MRAICEGDSSAAKFRGGCERERASRQGSDETERNRVQVSPK